RARTESLSHIASRSPASSPAQMRLSSEISQPAVSEGSSRSIGMVTLGRYLDQSFRRSSRERWLHIKMGWRFGLQMFRGSTVRRLGVLTPEGSRSITYPTSDTHRG